MNLRTKPILLALLALTIGAGVWATLWQKPVPKPKLFKSTVYPPTTPDEKAMWVWWNSMRKADPDFEWKTPIEFYGKVVDQNNEPVAAANIQCNWAALPNEENKRMLQSGPDGTFSLTHVRGKVLSILISKIDCVSGTEGHGGFEYAAFFEPDFHIPNPQAPVTFRLWKLLNAEPMYLWTPAIDLTVDGQPHSFNVNTGKKGGDDLTFIVTRSNEVAIGQFDYTVTIQAGTGGGLVETKDDPMFVAPAEGYQPSISLIQKFGASDYEQCQKFRFYLKTSEGKFAAVKAEIMQHNARSAQAQLVIYYNPSGSLNLEYDYKKRIKK